ncbi:electron transport complex subunit RsxG [Buchnera aphidicola]|uniref:electron transport complex subunit RsxG n=1 Tax=Buchnera aphidicola TaxID=9 RepID=UPI003BEF4572
MVIKIYEKKNIILKHSILLSIFTTIFISITVFLHDITNKNIIIHTQEEKKILLKEIIPKKIYFSCRKKKFTVKNKLLGDNNIHNLWIFFNNKIEQAAAVESVAPDGYAGSIHLLVAAYFDGTIIGVRVLSHKETPGIGDKIEISISNWISKFNNMRVLHLSEKKFFLKKYGGQIDQFTGATITPQAVTNAINRTVIFIKMIPLKLMIKKIT